VAQGGSRRRDGCETIEQMLRELCRLVVDRFHIDPDDVQIRA
jgi:hypothetical protein